jgi:hypothetical protein
MASYGALMKSGESGTHPSTFCVHVSRSQYLLCFAALDIWARFISTSRSAYRNRARGKYKDVVEFSCETANYELLNSVDGKYKFLIQRDYLSIWAFCQQKRLSNDPFKGQLIVLGTEGIGKSAARLLYILMFLERELDQDFDFVVFNFSEMFFAVDSEGNVSWSSVNDPRWSRSLLLLDPCAFLSNAQTVPSKMLIVFTSASPVSGHVTLQLSGLAKNSNTYVMNAPTVDDLAKLYEKIDEERLNLFSWWVGETRHCSLRWFTYTEETVSARLWDALPHTNREGLWDWFMSNKGRVSRDNRLPFRLCVVKASREKGWMISGFISKGIERYVFDWAMGNGERNASELINLLSNRFLRGGLCIYFENWLFKTLGKGTTTLRVENQREFKFSRLEHVRRHKLKMELGVLYKLDNATFLSIEGYALCDKVLLLLQSTVSTTHGAVRYDHVRPIIHKAKETADFDELLVVYIVPSHQAFALPDCYHFPRITKVVWATINDSAFFQGLLGSGASNPCSGSKRPRL